MSDKPYVYRKRISQQQIDHFYETVDYIVTGAVERIHGMRIIGVNDESMIAQGARRLSDEEVQAYAHAFEMAEKVVEYMRPPEWQKR